MRRHLLIAVMAGWAMVGAAAAHAVPILTQADAEELVETLREASERQGGVCYGWTVSVGIGGSEVGSSQGGPGVALLPSSCERYAILVGRINYVPEASESDDSAAVSVDTNLDINYSPERLGLTAKTLITERDDSALVSLVEGLPLIVAEDANLPYVAFEPRAEPLAGDGPTNRPGSDWWRQYWGFAVVLILLPLVIVAALAMTRLKNRSTHAQQSSPTDKEWD